MNTRILLTIIFIFIFLGKMHSQDFSKKDSTEYIQLCLLLDVSGSMRGLLNQAQTHIWEVINHLEQFEKEGESLKIEVGILSYGNNFFVENGHINIVSPFTSDFDTLSEKLFLIEIGGGNEFCGAAIQMSLDSLKWKNENTQKFIFIAGNEPFDQGEIDYKNACQKAIENDIIINTIFCGDWEEGKFNFWENAAQLGNGEYSNIDQSIEVEEFKSPFDNKIVQLYFDYEDSYRKQNEDFNYRENSLKSKGEISPSYRDRLIYQFRKRIKEKDYLDKFEENNWKLDSLFMMEIPDEMRAMDENSLRQKLYKLSRKRSVAREAMELYSQKVGEYLSVKVGPNLEENTLNIVIKQIIEKQLLASGFSLKK